MMRTGNSSKPPVDRLATGVRMATVVVVVGTLAAVWHPGMHRQAANTIGDNAVASAPADMRATARSADATYFPSRFPAPENVEPQAPTF